jgi:hypothetical protein
MLRKLVEINLLFIQAEFLLLIGQNFPQSTSSFHLFQHPAKPDWLSLKMQLVSSSETSAKCLATQFETACQINNQHLNSCSCGNTKTCCINKLFTWQCMSHWGRRMTLTVSSEVAEEQGITVLYTDGMFINFRYSVFCINFMHINGRTD